MDPLPSQRGVSWWDVVVSLVLLVTAMLSYRHILELSLTTIDAVPIIEASRVERPGEIGELLRRELRNGTDWRVSYYRPFTLSTYTISYLLSGWNAFGYHLADLLFHGLATVSVFWLSRLAFGVSTLGSAVVASIFILHPCTLEVVPAISRRQEPFLVIAFATTVIGARYLPSRGGWLIVLFGSVMAVTSVERGLVVPAVLFAYLFAYRLRDSRCRWRLRRAVAWSLPVMGVSIAFYLLRAAMFRDSGINFDPVKLMLLPLTSVMRLFYPQGFLGDLAMPRSAADAMVPGAVALVFGGCLLWAYSRSDRKAIHDFVVLATSAYFLLFAVAGLLRPWYIYTAVPWLALSIHALAASGVRELRAAGSLRACLRGVASLGIGSAVLALVAFPSPVFHEYGAWRVASELSSTVRAELTALAARLPDDVAIVAINVPSIYRETEADFPVTRFASIQWPFGLRLWAEVDNIGNEVVMLGSSVLVGGFAVPEVEFDGDRVRIYFSRGAASYLAHRKRGVSRLPSSLGRGFEFPLPPRGLVSKRYQPFLFDGRTFVPLSK